MEKIHFDEKGNILPVSMSSAGFSADLPAEQEIPAPAACDRVGSCYFTRAGEKVILTDIRSGSRVVYSDLRFSEVAKTFHVRLRTKAPLQLTLRVDSLKNLPAVFSVPAENDWKWYEFPVSVPAGKHSEILSFHRIQPAEMLCELESFRFSGER